MSDCENCTLQHTRREFLADAARAGLAVLMTLGASQRAAAGSLSWIAGRAANGTVSYPLPATDGASIDRDNEVILVRWQQHVYAFALSCPHQHTALRWQESDGRFQCPKHKSKYQPDGTFISGRATRGMDRFALHREGGNIVVDLATLYKQTDNAEGWKGAVVTL